MKDAKKPDPKKPAPKKIRLGIRTKIGAVVTLAGLLLAGVVIYNLYTTVKSALLKELEKRGRVLATALADRATDPVLTKSTDVLKKIIEDFRKEEAAAYSLITDDEGKILAHSFDSEPPSTIINRIKEMDKKTVTTERIFLSEEEIIHIGCPILKGIVGNVYLGLSTERIKDEVNLLILRLMGILGVAFILIFSVGIVIASRIIVNPLKEITSVAEAVGHGDLTRKVDIKTHDEVGELGKTLNETIERLQKLIQTEEEQRKTQENIIDLLNLLSSASEGDLTQKAVVTPDIFGTIGDAFNLMVEGLSELIERARNSAEDVNTQSRRILGILKKMKDGSEIEMVEVKHAMEAIDLAASSARDITEKTKEAQRISEVVIQAVNKGNKLVLDSIEGVQLIRVTIQAINKRMKYLSERLVEVDTISQLINELTNRTNLLAINAAIEAARAGEQGRGFIVIADEIKNLAERATKSTKQIGEIISAIQVESARVTRHLEEETNYVEMETKLATDTGIAFKEIDLSIKDAVALISEISSFANNQKELTAKVVLSMEAVQKITKETLNMFKEASNISTALSDTSNTLISSVERFKLPETERMDV